MKGVYHTKYLSNQEEDMSKTTEPESDEIY